jgi:nicotinamidase-related amidase
MNTALLVIDVQESFRQRPDDWNAMGNPQLVDHVNRLVEAARAAGHLIVWITHAEHGTNNVFDPASGFVRVIDELEPIDREPQITKTSVNAFTTTNLQQQLTEHGVAEVIVCGIRTEQCCETTARVASDLGYGVTFVTDATTTSGIAATSGRASLTAQEIMARTETILAAREFATIATTDEVVRRTVALAQ